MGMQVVVDAADQADNTGLMGLRIDRALLDPVDSDVGIGLCAPNFEAELAEHARRISQADVVIDRYNDFGGDKKASEKSIKLLKENLTPKQLETYEKHRWFEVKGGDTGRTYRIYHRRQMNVSVRNWRGKHKHGLCFLPTGGLAIGDILLGQKIALELYEHDALKVANRFDHDPGIWVTPFETSFEEVV
jgi:hypothetical protein